MLLLVQGRIKLTADEVAYSPMKGKAMSWPWKASFSWAYACFILSGHRSLTYESGHEAPGWRIDKSPFCFKCGTDETEEKTRSCVEIKKYKEATKRIKRCKRFFEESSAPDTEPIQCMYRPEYTMCMYATNFALLFSIALWYCSTSQMNECLLCNARISWLSEMIYITLHYNDLCKHGVHMFLNPIPRTSSRRPSYSSQAS